MQKPIHRMLLQGPPSTRPGPYAARESNPHKFFSELFIPRLSFCEHVAPIFSLSHQARYDMQDLRKSSLRTVPIGASVSVSATSTSVQSEMDTTGSGSAATCDLRVLIFFFSAREGSVSTSGWEPRIHRTTALPMYRMHCPRISTT